MNGFLFGLALVQLAAPLLMVLLLLCFRERVGLGDRRLLLIALGLLGGLAAISILGTQLLTGRYLLSDSSTVWMELDPYAPSWVFSLHLAPYTLLPSAIAFTVATAAVWRCEPDRRAEPLLSSAVWVCLLLFGVACGSLAGVTWLLVAGWSLVGLSTAMLLGSRSTVDDAPEWPVKWMTLWFLSTILLAMGCSLYERSAIPPLTPWRFLPDTLIEFKGTPTVGIGAIDGEAKPLLSASALLIWLATLVPLAQFPLLGWLGDASKRDGRLMAILFVCLVPMGIVTPLRFQAVFMDADRVRDLMAIVGLLTLFTGGVIAMAQPTWRTRIAHLIAGATGVMMIGLATGHSSGLLGALLMVSVTTWGVAVWLLIPDREAESSLPPMDPMTGPIARGLALLVAVVWVAGIWGSGSILEAMLDRRTEWSLAPFLFGGLLFGLLLWSLAVWLTVLRRFRRPDGVRLAEGSAAEHSSESFGPLAIPFVLLLVITPLLALHLRGIAGLPRIGDADGSRWWVLTMPVASGLVTGLIAWWIAQRNLAVSPRTPKPLLLLGVLGRYRLFLDQALLLLVVVPLRALAQLARAASWILFDGFFERFPRGVLSYFDWVSRPIRTATAEFRAVAMIGFLAAMLFVLVWLGGAGG